MKTSKKKYFRIHTTENSQFGSESRSAVRVLMYFILVLWTVHDTRECLWSWKLSRSQLKRRQMNERCYWRACWYQEEQMNEAIASCIRCHFCSEVNNGESSWVAWAASSRKAVAGSDSHLGSSQSSAKYLMWSKCRIKCPRRRRCVLWCPLCAVPRAHSPLSLLQITRHSKGEAKARATDQQLRSLIPPLCLHVRAAAQSASAASKFVLLITGSSPYEKLCFLLAWVHRSEHHRYWVHARFLHTLKNCTWNSYSTHVCLSQVPGNRSSNHLAWDSLRCPAYISVAVGNER